MSNIRETIIFFQQSRNLSLEDAAAEVKKMGLSSDAVELAVESIRSTARSAQLLKVPGGVTEMDYERLVDDLRGKRWYGGSNNFDKHWPTLFEQTKASIGADAAESVDVASTKIMSLLADPGVHGLKKKGLVIGYVQSGKTANFAAVMAKAADAGFRLFIVLSGIHNSLRKQTQERLDEDLVAQNPNDWVKMTNCDADFGSVIEGAGLLATPALRNLIVIKKNTSRLKKLGDWLESIPEGIRQRCPAIIIDDEADQATPNSSAALSKVSAINKLTNRVFNLLPTATYLGYTATPFANVLMNPSEAQDLYPSDFIIDLPRPDAYFGAEQLFGIGSQDDEERDADGLDVIRKIPSKDIEELQPVNSNNEKTARLPKSLADAIHWFVLTIAIRRLRGQGSKNMSMLVHTSHLVEHHEKVAALVRKEVARVKRFVKGDSESHDIASLKAIWTSEKDRVDATRFNLQANSFDEVLKELGNALDSLDVIIDNGKSNDRLDYSGKKPVTVIAVGGQTLSRGLTLEGLAVSWFSRTSKTYDTLLQMGRWFGYRIGYEDLPRVWMTTGMRNNFRKLAAVEQELRTDIEQYSIRGVTPRQLGLRILQHPGMTVTAPGKMHYARKVSVSFAGTIKQTFRFDHRNHGIQQANIKTARNLVASVQADALHFRDVGGRFLVKGVDANRIVEFLKNFHVSAEHNELQPEVITKYLLQRKDDTSALWNLAIMSSSRIQHSVGGETHELGTLDLGLTRELNLYNRAPLQGFDAPAHSNIKALMSNSDKSLDLGIKPSDITNLKDARAKYASGRGLLLIYPIAGKSLPISASAQKSRTTFDHAVDMVGYGIIFPEHVNPEGTITIAEHDYVGLPEHLLPGAIDAEEDDTDELQLLDGDDEESNDVDGLAQMTEKDGA